MKGNLFYKNNKCYYFINDCSVNVKYGSLTMVNPKIKNTFYERRWVKNGIKYCDKATYLPLRDYYSIIFEGYATDYACKCDYDITLQIENGILYTDIEAPDWVFKTQDDASKKNTEYLDNLEKSGQCNYLKVLEEPKTSKKKKSIFDWFKLKKNV